MGDFQMRDKLLKETETEGVTMFVPDYQFLAGIYRSLLMNNLNFNVSKLPDP
jgi:hypothetical protein